ncbi:hypothetical protein FNAPI_3214 [Fusarium napiforme]|uniref:NmrA-like domain-containing protein n=1 Tax=Fusarium napiforme TaxID=42672 RepID=A0A8H5JVU8_9HYPO|nr:hypothetical protein FNAPI_3214 [Fusarium napiforme]
MAAKKVAVVGGSGSIGREVVDEILARGSYEVVILSRGAQAADLPKGVAWKQVDYNDKSALVDAVKGIDTVLSFLAMFDQNEALELHKKLIDASIEAGVRRFAPSEWASASNSGIPHYQYKDEVRKYLEEVNSDQQKVQYCLFQPGMFTDYFGYPHATTKHFNISCMFVDFQNRRAIIPDGDDAPIILTTVRDMSRLVAQALEYDGVWPTRGGMQGTAFTVSELIALGEKLRGPFKVEKLSDKDLKTRNVTTSWYPLVTHHSLPVEMREPVSKGLLVETMASLKRGVWTVSVEWNKLLPDFEFTTAESYLKGIWL